MTDQLRPSPWFDADGYFWTILELPPPAKHVSWESIRFEDNAWTVSVLHYLLRSSMVIWGERAEEMKQSFRDWSRMCLDYAYAYAPDVQGATRLGPPGWTEIVHDFVSKHLRNSYPDISDITVSATLDQRLYARSFPAARTIEVSALTREYLRTFNLVIWSHVFAALDGISGDGELSEIEIIRSGDPYAVPLLKSILPYLLSLHRDVILSSLPMVRPRNEQIFGSALRTTHIQLTFFLAHEYAHMALHGNVPPSQSAEIEADKFAYELLMKLSWKYDRGDIWTAIRWFFKLLEFDKIIGEFLYGGEINWDQDAIENRLQAMYEYAFDGSELAGISKTDNMLEALGSYLIFAAKGIIDSEDGLQWLRECSSEYYEQYGWSDS